jgi:hypothetical protein
MEFFTMLRPGSTVAVRLCLAQQKKLEKGTNSHSEIFAIE